MVDWVLGRARGSAPTRSSSSPRRTTQRRVRGRRRSPSRREPRGTGDAVASARGALEGFAGDVLVLDAGDTPLLTAELLAALVDRAPSAQGAAVTVLSFEPPSGRCLRPVVRDADGCVERDRRGAGRVAGTSARSAS